MLKDYMGNVNTFVIMETKMKKVIALILLAMVSSANASISIECFGPDGRIIYKDPNATKYIIEVAATTIWDSSGNPVVVTAAAPCMIVPNQE